MVRFLLYFLSFSDYGSERRKQKTDRVIVTRERRTVAKYGFFTFTFFQEFLALMCHSAGK